MINQAICDAVKEKHHLLIGTKTAEQLKLHLASALEPDAHSMKVLGRY